MNYIKGFRYELYVLARNAMTSLCVVFCNTDIETARSLCEKSEYENPHPVDMFTDYCQRLERPNPSQRWDKPCFELRFDEDTPYP